MIFFPSIYKSSAVSLEYICIYYEVLGASCSVVKIEQKITISLISSM
jgi:hypothetical protein